MSRNVNVIFLTDSYYPSFSPVAKCTYNVALEIAKKYKVTIITIDGSSEYENIDVARNHDVIRGYIKNIAKLIKYGAILRSGNRLENIKYKLLILKMRLAGYLRANFSKTNINQEIINCYIKQMDKIKVDVVIPACLPFESIVAACEYKNRKSRVILLPFLFDRFTNNTSLHRNRINRILKKKTHFKLEEKMIKSAQHIFAMHQLYDNFKINFPEYISKFSFVEHPLLQNYNLFRIADNNNLIRLIYAGVLYKKYRSPLYVLKVADLINKNIAIDFYSSGNCENIIKKYVKKSPSKICQKGFVSQEELSDAYLKSNILVSIGNSRSCNMPSKIFEYISMGKPIIHFYELDEDPVLSVLNRYPLALVIKQDEQMLEENTKKVQFFCEKNWADKIDFGEVIDLYPDATPSVVAQYFADEIEYHLKYLTKKGG